MCSEWKLTQLSFGIMVRTRCDTMYKSQISQKSKMPKMKCFCTLRPGNQEFEDFMDVMVHDITLGENMVWENLELDLLGSR